MKISKDSPLFTGDAKKLLVKKMEEKGILGEWEKPLSLNCVGVKNSCSDYFSKLLKYDVVLIDNSTRTDRILYNPERYTKEQALEYGDAP